MGSAFAPAKQSASTTAIEASPYANELGAQAPLGFFDPLGLLDDADQSRFDRLREVEIKHGRVSMLAVVGYLTTEAGIRLPGMDPMGSGFKAFEVEGVPMEVRGCLPFTLGCIAILECFMRDVTGEAEFPGDYRNGVNGGFGWDAYSEERKMKKRAIELNNGRAAQ